MNEGPSRIMTRGGRGNLKSRLDRLVVRIPVGVRGAAGHYLSCYELPPAGEDGDEYLLSFMLSPVGG